MTSSLFRLSAALALTAIAGPASAQLVTRQYVDAPTNGLTLPTTGLAGDYDARAVSANPAGLQFIDGADAVLLAGATDSNTVANGGAGIGLFVAGAFGGKIIPRTGVGLAIEGLYSPRDVLLPDPGSPVRLTLSESLSLGRHGSLGLSWHHFFDDGTLGGIDTFDAGFSWRLGNYVSLGGVVRDLTSPVVALVPVQRRYELELATRPLGHSGLEFAVGGRVGEVRGDLDGWFTARWRVLDGVTLHGTIESRQLYAIDTAVATGAQSQIADRDVRAFLGLELSFGNVTTTAYGEGRRDEHGGYQGVGGTIALHLTSAALPSLSNEASHVERMALDRTVSPRTIAALTIKLRAIAKDPGVKALVVTLDDVGGGWGTLDELRSEIARVRDSGKKVFAYMVNGSDHDYFVATAANKIFVDPAGGVRLLGMSSTVMYWKGAFDLVGVTAQFEKIAEFKSAPEAFTQTGPSPVAKAMREDIYDSLNNDFVEAIAKGRHLDAGAVRLLVDGGPYTAGDLVKDKRLVDDVADPEQVANLVAHELGGYYPVGNAPKHAAERWQPAAIAVIYADGDIVDGKSKSIPLLGGNVVGGESIATAIAAARENPEIAAIVLRIDSPGGSAVASEMMSREVFRTRGVKPIICSMGDLAASGGYFLAAGCDEIFADPMTITGSIGIFSGKFDLSGLLGKIGITTDTTKRGAHADLDSMYRPFTDDERESLRKQLTYMYGRFTDTVAAGRALTKSKVEDLSRGHVYTGRQALANGLVDHFGGLGDALDEAKRKAGVAHDEHVRLIELPTISKGLLGWILGSAQASDDVAVSWQSLPLAKQLLGNLPASVVLEPEAPQARLPYDIK